MLEKINSFRRFSGPQMMPIPSPGVPFVEYVLRAIDHPPHMFVSKLAACCGVLFLTRSDPKLLRSLCYRWASRFARDREKLIAMIRRRAECSGLTIGSSERTFECEFQPDPPSSGVSDRKGVVENPCNASPGQGDSSLIEYTDGLCSSMNVCNPDKVVDYFLSILNSLAYMYFSWNWNCADYIVQNNKEYEIALRHTIFPICTPTAAEDGVDDEEQSSYLLPLYIKDFQLDAVSLSTSNDLWEGEEEKEDKEKDNNINSRTQWSDNSSSSPELKGKNLKVNPSRHTRSEVAANLDGDNISLEALILPRKSDNIDNPNTSPIYPSCTLKGDEKQYNRSLPTDNFYLDNLPQPRQNGIPKQGRLTFLTLNNLEKCLQSNHTGLLILFHAKHLARSNAALGILSTIACQKTVDPMPAMYVVYSVAEPELANLFDVHWFPTIVYIPQSAHEWNGLCENPNTSPQGDITSRMRRDEPVGSPTCPLSADLGCRSLQPCSSSVYTNESLDGLLNSDESLHPCTTPHPHPPRPLEALSHGLLRRYSSLSNLTAYPSETASILPIPSTMRLLRESPTKVLYGLDAPNGFFPFVPPAAAQGPLPGEKKGGEEGPPALAQAHVKYPKDGVLRVGELAQWVRARGACEPALLRTGALVTEVVTLREDQKFDKAQEPHSSLMILRRMQGNPGGERKRRTTTTTTTTPPFPVPPAMGVARENGGRLGGGEEPPQFIFFGGGMAAGKSTIAMALVKTSWWEKHKGDTELINADDFKSSDSNLTFTTSEEHLRSTWIAEKVMVEALNQGRNVVYDGTMMWAPFISQVVDMVRNAHIMLYEKGPGYLGEGQPEVYFIPTRKRESPLPVPYKIIFMGITVEPQVAVPRGLLRKFESGRGVPIFVQLNSFKLFSKNFNDYTKLMDVVTLYNNNVIVDLEKGELPPILAELNESTNGELKIYDAAYELFQRQQHINIHARNVMEIYPDSNFFEMP
ncbi:unnamed protein product [Phytomonas sp. Hart1]|nr:unnamed protein product [Phytomonas sp. Hart1]|eukprot:CCW66584.1 unnamed protein product [Phytomonas sp. isolate Hart1]